ncbi:MAG: NADH-quinone oxidoreductase subunit M [Bacteroidia bacterium]|nr:NADH-quinone oxidoreductase subunit M [Bacteroidia bacterium]
MAAFALNLLWLLPVTMAGAALMLNRKSLRVLTLMHALWQLFFWGILYREKGAGLQWLWFRLGGKAFFYGLGAHSANLALLLLTILVGHIALLYGQGSVGRVRSFSALLFLVMGFAQGVFLARDLLLFFVFYEAALVPAFLLIYGWGGERRREAAVKFALFTLGGSVFFLIGILLALQEMPTGLREDWSPERLPSTAWLLMTIGLGVKLPLVPLHSWLGEAHVETDTSISMILASILLKLGGYGLLYWVWRALSGEEALLLRIWGGLSLLYAAAIATGEIDLKRLIAFTSIGHMALVALGAGSQSLYGLQGAYHQLFTHGLISAGLFAWVGTIEKAFGNRRIDELRGILKDRPFQAVLLFFGAMGVPGMALFVSELMVVWGTAVGVGWWWALIPALSLVLTAIYFLRAYRELAAPTPLLLSPGSLAPFFRAVVWFFILLSVGVGLYPKVWLDLLADVGY